MVIELLKFQLSASNLLFPSTLSQYRNIRFHQNWTILNNYDSTEHEQQQQQNNN